MSRETYHGWRIVAALAATTTVSYGVLYYAFAVVVTPMEAELGLSRAQTSGAFSLALLVAGFAAIPIGRTVDRFGARALMTVGSLGAALSVFAWSRVGSLGALYAVFALIGVTSACVYYDVAFTVVAVWFKRQRARATLTITLVAGFASTIFVPLTTLLVAWLGWRDALAVLALILGAITVPAHALTLRRHPHDLGLEPDGASVGHTARHAPRTLGVSLHTALRSQGFWWLTVTFALEAVIGSGLAAHLVPLLIERRYDAVTVAAAVGLIGVTQVFGRLVFTPLGARWPLETATVVVLALRLGALGALVFIPFSWGVWAFVVLYGASNGALTLARAAIIAEWYGSRAYGGISGAMSSASSLVQALAPLAAGALYTASGGYSAVLWALFGASGLAVVAYARARRAHVAWPGLEARW
jgi:MFS family permease